MPSYSGIFILQTQMQAKAASNWPSPPPSIGDAYGGGFFAGQIGVGGVATHNLVVGPKASAESSVTSYKTANTATPGADSVIDGPQNTADMVADGSSAVYPSAHFCNNLVTGGFSDWYMPAKNELEVCYYNLKPSTDGNDTADGINPNAIPPRASNYTSGIPAQTSAAAFVTGTGAEAFVTNLVGYYWSSTENSATQGFVQYFLNGNQFAYNKTEDFRVRAIRRVAV